LQQGGQGDGGGGGCYGPIKWVLTPVGFYQSDGQSIQFQKTGGFSWVNYMAISLYKDQIWQVFHTALSHFGLLASNFYQNFIICLPS
jgi:hypothetical protein